MRTPHTHPSQHQRESGQVIILIVFAFVGLLAAVGLVVDLGRYLALQTQLRRASDAAALAGAAQFRLAGSTATDAQVYAKVTQAARASLRVSGVATTTLSCITCTIIDTAYTDASMITSPPTKKVRIRLHEDMPLYFLSLVGFRSVGVDADSTTEAASVDVALVIDISDSMANDVCSGGDYPCVYTCDNPSGSPPLGTTCQPFYDVKAAARSFLDYLSVGYDRVTVIPFGLHAGYCINVGDVWPYCAASQYTKYVPLTTDLNAARSFIDNLGIGIPWWAGSPPGYPIPPCPSYLPMYDYDPRQCTNTNIGGGLRAAATELLKEFDPGYSVIDPNAGQNHPSKERLRVIILLTDGAANASGLGAEGADYGHGFPDNLGFCPDYTWTFPPAGPFCRAADPILSGPKQDVLASRHMTNSVYYDAFDYAADWADFAMLLSPAGNEIVMFTIGLGSQVTVGGGDGELLLRYVAAGGDDGDLSTDPCAGAPLGTSCGNYYYAPSGAQLLDIFKAIAGRIFTRINQ